MKNKINYWYESDYVMGTYEEEVLLRFIHNGKIKYNVHHYSCMKQKFTKLEVGKTYWIDVSESLMSSSLYKKCVIPCTLR